MGAKCLFAVLVVLGCRRLAGAEGERGLRRTGVAVAVLLALAPLATASIEVLLCIQAPVMIAAAAGALIALRRADLPGTGLAILRGALVGLGATWTLHAAAFAVAPRLIAVQRLNSFLDLTVQLLLGVGLVVCLLLSSHLRALRAEQERERMRRSVERDHNLRALGSVVSRVAHELNNPLTVILGFAEIQQRAAPPPRGAAVIAEQAERCRGIVRNLSALAGQSAHPRERVDVEVLARRVVRGLCAVATGGGRSVRVEPMAGLACSADRIGLEQVLANLVQNGLQAGPPGGVVVVAGRATNAGIEIAVTDEGPGIAPDVREHLFEPFLTTKAPGEGTGLGLAIADAIVGEHGGSIRVEDRPHARGATFVVTLPDAGTSAPPRTEPERGAAGRTVLLVDDDPAVREILRAEAEHRGWRVREAGSAEELVATPPTDADAILCDLRMPGIGGIGLHDRWAMERPDLLARVAFTTGDLASEGAVAFSRRSSRPILQKPFDLDEVFAALADVAEAAGERTVVVQPFQGTEAAPAP
jgi:signal transduction histidine kinase/CheY-like chemotaxis protein